VGTLEGLSDGANVGAVGFDDGTGDGKVVGIIVLLLQVPQDTGHSI